MTSPTLPQIVENDLLKEVIGVGIDHGRSVTIQFETSRAGFDFFNAVYAHLLSLGEGV